jgi:hypothetical protein
MVGYPLIGYPNSDSYTRPDPTINVVLHKKYPFD